MRELKEMGEEGRERINRAVNGERLASTVESGNLALYFIHSVNQIHFDENLFGAFYTPSLSQALIIQVASLYLIYLSLMKEAKRRSLDRIYDPKVQVKRVCLFKNHPHTK